MTVLHPNSRLGRAQTRADFEARVDAIIKQEETPMPGRYTHVKPRNERNYPVYEYKELLAAIGSDADIQDAIASYGFDKPSVGVIRGWRRRNSIPSTWLPLLMHALTKKHVPVAFDKLLKAPF